MSQNSSLRVLVVDDEPLVRDMLKELLKDLGYDVVALASGGHSAIEKTNIYKPDVVCLDINMPDISGLDALASIKTISANIVVIMVTANNDVGTVQQAIRTGADGYIIKPFKSQDIDNAIRKALSKRQKS
ncbi:response regulator [Marinospirillum alkaliphilum]|uniref:Two-component system, chemotaxis family, response regulator CheY n=1 Tax=Marinospirillum alkaliphilum DSM 21637 TaxID=1122209 RepID=A0A1K1XJC3_9GAMM|nr:response regulator [Marinospirillum alkaliphilum]SFX49654.1 two-component system, chemotaxis family, response regulator CheY [Marinospirillum alkaliphilum DSM 21637]